MINAKGIVFNEDEVRCLCGTLHEECEYLNEQEDNSVNRTKLNYYLEAYASIEQTWAIIFASEEEKQMFLDIVIDSITVMREYPGKDAETAAFTAHIINVLEGVLKKIS